MYVVTFLYFSGAFLLMVGFIFANFAVSTKKLVKVPSLIMRSK